MSQALDRNGIHLEHPCNCQGICGSCKIWVVEPEGIAATPHESISEEEEKQGCRLSCQLVPKRDMSIRLPMNLLHDAAHYRESQNILEGDLAPVFRLVSAVQLSGDPQHPEMRYDNLPAGVELKQWRRDYEPKGLGVDLGTTTIVVTLVSLLTGKELATASRLNPQIRFGHDVMTRIQHGSTPEGLRELAQTVRQGINELIMDVCADSGANSAEILDVVLGGNTTMLQVLAEMDPSPLGEIPFTVSLKSGTSYSLQQFGLQANPAARVYVPPILHAFVGTDITAGLLLQSDFFLDEKRVLYIDVGTNGEIALNARGRRLVCSTAAGPAFEGMGISCGMRASIGAVESVTMGKEDLRISTVGNAPVRGICGSGIVDLLAHLLRLGILDATGRYRYPPPEGLPEALASRVQKRGEQIVFALGRNCAFTQNDVRQVQLAKGAVKAGIEVLLEEAGCRVEDLDTVYLAGGFGFYLSAENIEGIGLIPQGLQDRLIFTGNSSRNGCVWLLCDISYRRFLEENASGFEHVSLAQSPRFMENYVEGMEFEVPHKG